MKKTAAAEKKLAVVFDRQMRHVLQLSCGLSVELLLDVKTRRAIGVWSERPTWELMPTVLREYPRWRDEILEAWLLRRGKTSVSIPLPKVVIRQQMRSRSKATSKPNVARANWLMIWFSKFKHQHFAPFRNRLARIASLPRPPAKKLSILGTALFLALST
jgi:hypothetical protein